MAEQNEVRLTGSIDRVKRINTKTGSNMAEVLLQVRKDRFRIVAFGNLADFILTHGKPGEVLGVTGTLATSSWKDEATGEWRNSVEVTAWVADLDGRQEAYQRKQRAAQPSTGPRRYVPPVAQPDDPF